jgi:hypothetical protein
MADPRGGKGMTLPMPLVMWLGVIVRHELLHRSAQMTNSDCKRAAAKVSHPHKPERLGSGPDRTENKHQRTSGG